MGYSIVNVDETRHMYEHGIVRGRTATGDPHRTADEKGADGILERRGQFVLELEARAKRLVTLKRVKAGRPVGTTAMRVRCRGSRPRGALTSPSCLTTPCTRAR